MAILIIILAVVACVAIVAAAYFFLRQRRSSELREHFGPEYDRTLRDTGDRGRAERELVERQERVEQLRIQPLSPDEQARFADAWRSTQARFVDDPSAAIADADRLIGEVMLKRGYPVGDFESRAADLSVEHPNVVSNYRAAHTIAEDSRNGRANTEDLRNAMVAYRALFDELVQAPVEVRR